LEINYILNKANDVF